MEFKKKYLVGIGFGVVLLILDILLFFGTRWFSPLFIVALTVGWAQVWMDFFIEGQRQKEIEERFLDLVRNLAGAIKSGMPIPNAIIHIGFIDYGPLSPHVRKLAHQVEWSIPVHKALLFFSNSTNNDIIRRSVATVIEAEQSGGNMEDVLEAITESLMEIKKIKESRRASIHSQIMQSYVIFFVFLGVMIVIQNLLVPYLMNQNSSNAFTAGMEGGSSQDLPIELEVEIRTDSMAAFMVSMTRWFSSLKGIFLMLSLIQGLFAGIIVGKLSEGDLTSGMKHSLILMTVTFFVMTLVSNVKVPGAP
jgi:archaeal flagellar protein FlaJ